MPPSRKHHVGWLQIPVDEARAVGGARASASCVAICSVSVQGQRFAATLPGEPNREGLALEVFHDEELDTAGRPDVVQGADVWVGEAPRSPRASRSNRARA